MNNDHHGSHYLCCHHNCCHGEKQEYQSKVIPDLAGAIFFCNSETRKECFRRKLFCLPACREHFVRQVKKGMFLFLFDTDNRMMYGVFVATSNGDMNIVPDALSSTGKTYPAQVQFAIKSACRPLTEPEFKSAILVNYFTDVKFRFDLNFDQVQRLLVLFEGKEVRRVSRPITDRCFRRYSTSSPLDLVRNHNRGWYTANANLSRYASDRAQHESQIRDQVYDNGSQDQRKSVFLRMAPKRQREAWEEEPYQTVLCPTNNQSCDNADPDSGGMDGMMDPTTTVSNLTGESCETQIPFVNFNRRNRGSKLSIEPKGDAKKRRLIRPPLELEDERSPMQVANHFSEPLKEPSLVGTKSASNSESIEAQVNSKSVENLWGSVGKSEENQPDLKLVDTLQEGFQGHSEGEKALLGAIGMETGRGKLDQDTSLTAESSDPTVGQCGADINEIIAFIESESNKLKQQFEESERPLFRSDTGLDKMSDKLGVESEHTVETGPDDPPTTLVSGCQKTAAFKSNEASETFSDCHPDSAVLDGKTSEKTSVSIHEATVSGPVMQIEDSSELEGEPDNSKTSICSHNEKSNRVEERIAPEPKARDLIASLVSCMAKSKSVKEDLTLKPEADRLEKGPFSYQNSKPVEDFIPLEPYDENSRETFEYLEITVE